MRSSVRTVLVLAALAAALSRASAQDQAAFEKNLTVEKLPNGLTVMVYERDVAPVVSFYTYVGTGSAQEVPGITGIAHMFEHMAFKGTTRIGTTDYAAEKKALDKVDAAYHAYDDERRKRGGPDATRLEQLKKAWKDAQEEADRFIVKNEFGEIIDRAGGVGLNASTSADNTDYYYSLPSNKVELWAYLESERFVDPVFREFYKERDVVMEERRLRTESQPTGRLVEQFLAAAFNAHPYQQPTVGYMSDLMSFSREDADAFRKKYYVPNNIIIAIVGAVKAQDVLPMVRKYFERLPAAPAPEPLRTVEPKQIAEKSIVVEDPAQPIYVEAYHRPAVTDPDDAAYNALTDVLSTGRTSRLYRSLVRDKKLAIQASAFNGFPGEKYPNLVAFFAVPAAGKTNAEVQKAIREEIAKITSEPITDDELRMVKTRAKANLIRGLDDNTSIAIQLAQNQALFGDWRQIFRSIEAIDKVTKDDILRVAKATFVPSNRTVAMLENSGSAAAKSQGGAK